MIHKNQGTTVDRAFVLASGTMDRHLTYVAMTRHRDGAQLYAAQDEFAGRSFGQGMAAGRLVEHGAAPFEHGEGNRGSYFVTLENAKGERHTIWGVDLERAMAEAAPTIGATIGLQHRGSTPVTLPNGTETHRNTWEVQGAGELAWQGLERRLSRSGAKETTLDYTKEFAERRGIAERLGVRSEIELAGEEGVKMTPAAQGGWESIREGRGPAPGNGRAGNVAGEVHKDKDMEQRQGLQGEGYTGEGPAPGRDRGEGEGLRRNPFQGLKLGRSGAGETPAGRDPAEAGQEKPQEARKERCGMFDGLRLNAGPGERPAASQGRGEALPARQVSEMDTASARPAERPRASEMERAVGRYAQAVEAAHRQAREGLPVLEAHKQALRVAGQGLDQAQPGSQALLRSALRHDPEAERAMREGSGQERVGELMAGMERERVALANPNVRADRFVSRWQELQEQRHELRGSQHTEARQKVEGQIQGMAKSLERDPQVESLLQARRDELGVRQRSQGHSLAEDMERGLRQTRGMSIGR